MLGFYQRAFIVFFGFFFVFMAHSEEIGSLVQQRVMYEKAQSLLDAQKVDEYRELRP